MVASAKPDFMETELDASRKVGKNQKCVQM